MFFLKYYFNADENATFSKQFSKHLITIYFGRDDIFSHLHVVHPVNSVTSFIVRYGCVEK